MSTRPSESWHDQNPERVLELLQSSPTGLSSTEARSRLSRHGTNTLSEQKRSSKLLLLTRQFASLLILMLIASAVISLLLGKYVESTAILVIVILAGVLGFLQEAQAERAIASLRRMAAPTATALRDGLPTSVPSAELVPGDVILLHTGDRIPADARILESHSLQIDEAMLTGESLPVVKQVSPPLTKDTPLADRISMAYMGTSVSYGRGRAAIVSTGMLTELGMIAGMLQSTEVADTPLQKNLDSLGKRIGVFAVAIALIMSALELLRGSPLTDIFLWGVAVAVAIIPEALPAVVTITLALGVRRMVKRKALIRKLPAVETLGATNIICSDKTGTLTQDEMTVRKILTPNMLYTVTGVGYTPEGDIFTAGSRIAAGDHPDLLEVLQAGVLCSDVELRREENHWHIVGDPTEGAIVVVAAKAGIDIERYRSTHTRIHEIPFSSERKRMTTVHRSKGRIVIYSKGAPEVIIPSCSFIVVGGNLRRMSDDDRTHILQQAQSMGEEALRVLALAYKKPESEDLGDAALESDMVFAGFAGMIDPPRPEVKRAIDTCDAAGIRTIMITGDHKVTAMAVARELGILADGAAISGAELDRMSDDALDQAADSTRVYARISPAHKLRIVEALIKKGNIVAMTGDGVNDAPSLKRANIGIAMGITGTDVSKEASHMVLTDDNFASIVSAVEEGRSIFENIRKYLVYLLSGNMGTVIGLAIALIGNLPLPLSAAQILFINFVMDGIIAIALGVEPPEPGIMERKPRNVREGILHSHSLWFIAGVGSWIGIVCSGVFVWALNAEYSTENAMVLFFVTLILARLANAYNCRTLAASSFSIRPFTNRFLTTGEVFTLVLTALFLYVEPLRPIFRTFPLSLNEWLVVTIAAGTVIIIAESVKAVLRRKPRG